MKNKLSAALIFLLIISYIFGSLYVSADSSNIYTVGEVKNLIDGIIAFSEKEAGAATVQEWIDGGLAEGAGTTSDWYVIALSQYDGGYDFTAYSASLSEYLNGGTTASTVTRQRYALALAAAGDRENPYIAETLDETIGKQGVMSWIFGLHLLNNGYTSTEYTAADAAEMLLSLRLEDGGWALTGDVSDADITAMALQALAPFYDKSEDVKSAVDTALETLSQKQLDDGGFLSYGAENPESTAQVITALSSLGIDCITDSRFIKNGDTLLDAMLKYMLDDGSFCHAEGGETNPTSTFQAFYSLISLWRYQNRLGSLYIFDNTAEENPDEASETSTSSQENTVIGQSVDTSAENVQTDNGNISYKVWAYIAITILFAAACLILWLRKKHGIKNYIFVSIIAAAAVCAVLFTDIQTPGSYYSGESASKTNVIGTVTLTIRCDTVAGMSDSEYIPSDGVMLPVTEFEIGSDDTVYDILVEAARKYNIHIDMENTGGDMAYISGIGYLYEFDFGDLSGWVYHINGSSPSVGCGGYTLSDGDEIEWLYSREMGNDLK